jgi:dihydrolipoamide dehydrogenase
MAEKRDLVIIGGGPGGYVAALRAAQLKMKATLIEEDRIGGTCMNYGCIPTKSLLYQTHLFASLKRKQRVEGLSKSARLDWASAQAEKREIVEKLVRGTEFLLQRNGVEILRGRGLLRGEKKVLFRGEQEKEYHAEKIVLAMGSRSADLPFLKANGKEVITHVEALDLEEPPRSMIVVGAGAIGLEIGTIYSRLGTDVTVLEIMPTILPGMDRQSALRLERLIRKQDLKIFTEMYIDRCHVEGGQVRIRGACRKTRSEFELTAEKVLLAAGRRPNSEILQDGFSGLIDSCGFVRVNGRLETEAPGIYAIGDLIGGKLLAHKAQHEGVIAAENAAGASREMDYRALPMAVFTEPEFASVGLTEEEARAQGIQIKIGLFLLQANGRAVTLDSAAGAAKILASSDDRVIGAHLIAPFASEMIPELTLAVRKGLTLQDLSATIHIHPTVSEAMAEAALKAQGMALHALNQ